MDKQDITILIQGNPIRKGDVIAPRCAGDVYHEQTSWNDFGKIDITKELIVSVRKYFPQSSIILSTYRGSNFTDLDYDELVPSKDPGSEGEIYDGQPNNVNRIIVTSLSGLKKVNTRYTLKLRPDMLIEGLGFYEIFEKYRDLPPFDDHMKIFEGRVLANGFATLNNRLCFNLCDWFFLGLTEDLVNLFEVPLLDVTDSIYRQQLREAKEDYKLKGKAKNCVHSPEAYVLLGYIHKQTGREIMKHSEDDRAEVGRLCESYYMNNFIFAETGNYGLVNRKNKTLISLKNEEYFSHHVFVEGVKRYRKMKIRRQLQKVALHIIAGLIPLNLLRRKARALKDENKKTNK